MNCEFFGIFYVDDSIFFFFFQMYAFYFLPYCTGNETSSVLYRKSKKRHFAMFSISEGKCSVFFTTKYDIFISLKVLF